MAVAFHPDEEYVALESGNEVYIVGAKLASVVAEKTPASHKRSLRVFPDANSNTLNSDIRFSIARSLAFWLTTSPWTREPASVHTAPAHGAEDFVTGTQLQNRSDLQRGRERTSCATACLNMTGKQVFKANAPIVELLKISRRAHAYGKA